MVHRIRLTYAGNHGNAPILSPDEQRLRRKVQGAKSLAVPATGIQDGCFDIAGGPAGSGGHQGTGAVG